MMSFAREEDKKLGPIFRTFFSRENSADIFYPKYVCGEPLEFFSFKVLEVILPRISEENSAESDFPRKKCTKNRPPAHHLFPSEKKFFSISNLILCRNQFASSEFEPRNLIKS
jgi:hypothetical protein